MSGGSFTRPLECENVSVNLEGVNEPLSFSLSSGESQCFFSTGGNTALPLAGNIPIPGNLDWARTKMRVVQPITGLYFSPLHQNTECRQMTDSVNNTCYPLPQSDSPCSRNVYLTHVLVHTLMHVTPCVTPLTSQSHLNPCVCVCVGIFVRRAGYCMKSFKPT